MHSISIECLCLNSRLFLQLNVLRCRHFLYIESLTCSTSTWLMFYAQGFWPRSLRQCPPSPGTLGRRLLFVTVIRPARGFLFNFKPGVHVICKETHPSVFLPKMPYFMKFHYLVSKFDRFLKLDSGPGPSQHSF